MEKSKSENITIRSSEARIPWPYFNDKKAISSSSLTEILKEIEYKDKQIPNFVLMKAAENGKNFHRAIQNLFEKKDHEEISLSKTSSKKTNEKIEETTSFFKEKKFKNFLGSEILYHKFYKNNFFATYVDLDFKDFVIELKTNNTVINESKISVLIFRIQLLIQKICTNKEIYLLWSTGSGVYFENFKEDKELLEILKILLEILENKEIYSFDAKKQMIEKLLNVYSSPTKSFLLQKKND